MGHIVMIDPHGEYSAAFRQTGQILDVSNLQMPYWLMNFEEHCEVLLTGSGNDRQVDTDILAKCVLAARGRKPVVAVANASMCSAAYWIASAADEIVADANSIVGSIGVIAASFGFEDLMRRLGVQRRLYTAGSRKSMLDPFGPEKEEDVARLRALQDEIHANFRDWVSARRGARLTADREILFTGEFWTGTKAKALGLVDALGDARSDLRRRFGEKVRFRGVPVQGRSLRSLLGLSTPDAGWPDELVDSLETRALYARYGL
jgi:ClpP class serine protease